MRGHVVVAGVIRVVARLGVFVAGGGTNHLRLLFLDRAGGGEVRVLHRGVVDHIDDELVFAEVHRVAVEVGVLDEAGEVEGSDVFARAIRVVELVFEVEGPVAVFHDGEREDRIAMRGRGDHLAIHAHPADIGDGIVQTIFERGQTKAVQHLLSAVLEAEAARLVRPDLDQRRQAAIGDVGGDIVEVTRPVVGIGARLRVFVAVAVDTEHLLFLDGAAHLRLFIHHRHVVDHLDDHGAAAQLDGVAVEVGELDQAREVEHGQVLAVTGRMVDLVVEGEDPVAVVGHMQREDEARACRRNQGVAADDLVVDIDALRGQVRHRDVIRIEQREGTLPRVIRVFVRADRNRIPKVA